MSMAVRLAQGGRLVLPVSIRKALGLREGSALMVELKGTTLQLTPMLEAVARTQALLAPYRKRKKKLVDEFLEERRLEAERE